MSDTTKITKARVNGVLYELGGSGSGSIAGTYNFAPIKLSREVKGFGRAVLDLDTLCDYLEASGVDVDAEGYFNEDESLQSILICNYLVTDTMKTLLRLNVAHNYDDNTVVISIYSDLFNFNYTVLTAPATDFDFTMSLKETLQLLDVSEIVFNLESYYQLLKYIAINNIRIQYDSIHEEIAYDLKNVDGFFEDVFVEYTPGSSDSSY